MKSAQMKQSSLMIIICLILIGFLSNGCSIVFQKGRPAHVERISKLQRELNELERAKLDLEDRLGQQIADKDVKVEMMDRGLVITLINEVLFDSGKAKIRKEAYETLNQVARVLKTSAKGLDVGIDGHTDNVPIKHSGWKTNWELSSARALSVLHYLTEERGVSPRRLSATGYGEYRPVATNETKEGRQQNRRVEIVILPKTVKEEGLVEQPNLK